MEMWGILVVIIRESIGGVISMLNKNNKTNLLAGIAGLSKLKPEVYICQK